MKIVHIPAFLVPEVWDEASPLIEKALAYASGRFDINDVLEALLEGRLALVATFDEGKMIGAMTFEIVTYPRKRSLRIVFLGGERYLEWMVDATNFLEDWARRVGATLLEIEGRPGWEKYLKGKASKISVVLEREVL